MSLARVHARALVGVEARPVSVEVDIAGGLPAFTLVGLPETVVRESRDRVRAALLNAGFDFPQRRITVSLAPADLPKEGGRFDLPIALGLLAASGQLPPDALEHREFAGELSLGGGLRAVPGAVPVALAAERVGRTLVLPRGSSHEAALVPQADVRVADALIDVVSWLRGVGELDAADVGERVPPRCADLSDVRGQHHARRAMEIAAAGGHNVVLVGPPGSGKSMLASRLPGLLPPLDLDTALASAAVQSVSPSGFDAGRWAVPPFRSPHHTVSGVALVGGGSHAAPGEVSLAHGGVLFLDELAEFPRAVLDVLREPLETGVIHISRARRQATYPAAFQFVGAMNPCPCGYNGESIQPCRCTAEQVQRYQARVSGPFLDRIDLHVTLQAVSYAGLRQQGEAESSAVVAARVATARTRQHARQGSLNAHLGVAALDHHCGLRGEAATVFERAVAQLGLSLRSCHRVLRVARTVADLAGDADIATDHVGEALGFRSG
ncbi:MAG: YifB family Mg chelatase-like AAA ATPase [Pseudomonadota bacterium]